MNHDKTRPAADGPLDEHLRWQLRALRRDTEPAGDLWPGIAARIAAEPPRARREPRRLRLPFALAATVVLASASVAFLAGRPVPVTDSTALHEAQALEAIYADAFRLLDPSTDAEPIAPALAELDRSAQEIRRALDHDPGSRLLLEQLRRTYALRLALSQRALAS